MKITSNQLRFIVIISLGLIIVVAVALLLSDGRQQNAALISSQPGGISLQSFDSPGGQGSTDSTDPCGLLRREEIEAELGASVSDAQSGFADNPFGQRYCRFPDPKNSDAELFSFSIVFNNSMDPSLLDAGYNATYMFEGRKASPDLIQSVDDLGDDAFWGGTGPELWNGLHILVQDVYLTVNVYSGDPEIDYRVARNLAVVALERLFTP